eukprot:9237781-Alexandrium_andersonii.AAC.1
MQRSLLAHTLLPPKSARATGDPVPPTPRPRSQNDRVTRSGGAWFRSVGGSSGAAHATNWET